MAKIFAKIDIWRHSKNYNFLMRLGLRFNQKVHVYLSILLQVMQGHALLVLWLTVKEKKQCLYVVATYYKYFNWTTKPTFKGIYITCSNHCNKTLLFPDRWCLPVISSHKGSRWRIFCGAMSYYKLHFRYQKPHRRICNTLFVIIELPKRDI